jgi:hypothetical protein
MKRMWVDQPSIHQLLHHFHGINVLATPELDDPDFMRVYFLRGDIVSMRIPHRCLSDGWLKEKEQVK